MRRTFLTIVALMLFTAMAPVLAQQPPATPPAQTDQQTAPKADTTPKADTPAPKADTTRKARTPVVQRRFVRHYWYQWSAWPWNWHWTWFDWRYRHDHRRHY